MSSLLQRKLPSILHASALPIPHSYRKPLLLATGAAALSAPLLAYAYGCYAEWLALGRGGVPYNVFGWLAQSALHVLARTDLRDPVPRKYGDVADVGRLYGEAGGRSYLGVRDENGALAERKGPRPTVPGFVAPQRQTSDGASARTVAALNGLLAALADANPHLFELRPSRLEGPPHQALWLVSQAQEQKQAEKVDQDVLKRRLGRGAAGEWAHVHGEGSAHITLSPPDAALAIERGWAERHPVSGVGGNRAMVPWGYVMVYAPRDEGELAVWRRVLLAGARYVSQERGAVVVPE
ncbi:hypothetical protein F4781DRAFT_431538 [Annulohypoxylon bovei var. microspora]|nr:hypothetical protein F4781DRAFT_431538 [Annulohypoxylon bovei var. microspora]